MLMLQGTVNRGAYHSKKSSRDFWDFKTLKIFLDSFKDSRIVKEFFDFCQDSKSFAGFFGF